MRRAILTSAAVIALVLAACGEAAPAEEPTPTVEPTPAATPEPTPETTPDAPEATPAPGDGAAGDLVAMLPDEVDGLQLTREGMDGAEFMAEADDEFLEFLGRLGRSPRDVSAATAFGFDMDDGRSLFIFAIRVEGADTNQLRNEFRQSMEEAEEDAVEFREETIGGKQVLVGRTDDDDEFDTGLTYIYAVHDVLFLIGAADEDLAEAALDELP
jgi:hypothetical protein